MIHFVKHQENAIKANNLDLPPLGFGDYRISIVFLLFNNNAIAFL